jgi:hypothetical protein
MKKILILIMISLLSFNVVSKSSDSKKEENQAIEGLEDVGEVIKYVPIE